MSDLTGDTLDLKIFAGSRKHDLAFGIARYLGGTERAGVPECLGYMEIKRFADGEERVQFQENIRDRDVFLIQSTNPPAENLMRLCMMVDAARRASARRITAVIPYFGYARQDRKDRPRVPITSKLVVKMLESAGVDRILAMDLHVNQMEGFFEVPMDHLYARPALISKLQRMGNKSWRIVAPDAGAANRAEGFSQRLGQKPVDHIHKVRDKDGKIVSMTVVGDISPDDTTVIVDDMIDTGGTLIKVANAIKDRGAKEIIAVAAHGIFSGQAIQNIIESPIDMVLTTNSLSHLSSLISDGTMGTPDMSKFRIAKVDALFGEAIKRIHTGQGSISELFD